MKDRNNVILSLPPIINGDHSKITLNTKNVFIEITACDRTKGLIALNTICASLSLYSSKAHTIEPVLIEYEKSKFFDKGVKFVNPQLKQLPFDITLTYIKKCTGIHELTRDSVCKHLNSMMHEANSDALDSDKIQVKCPITRSDVLHQCDLAEDVAIAYGYNNIKYQDYSVVKELSVKNLQSQLREKLALLGFSETLTWGLCSFKEAFEFLQRSSNFLDVSDIDNYQLNSSPVLISNPKTKEFEILRTTLIPGLLKTVAANKARELPFKIFEIGNVARKDMTTESKTTSATYCAALICNNNSSCFEQLHGILDTLLLNFEFIARYNDLISINSSNNDYCIYDLELSSQKTFLPGRGVELYFEKNCNSKKLFGIMGVLHPLVLKAYQISTPCSVFEFSITPLKNKNCA